MDGWVNIKPGDKNLITLLKKILNEGREGADFFLLSSTERSDSWLAELDG